MLLSFLTDFFDFLSELVEFEIEDDFESELIIGL